jgi:hypothetical protein
MPMEKDGPFRRFTRTAVVGAMKPQRRFERAGVTTTKSAENSGIAQSGATKDTHMAITRPSQKQIAETKNALRQEEMERAVAEGRLVIRTMTAREREQSDARWTAAAQARDHRVTRRQYS